MMDTLSTKPKSQKAFTLGLILALLVAVLLLRAAASDQARAVVPARPVLGFAQTEHDFGEVVEGTVLCTKLTLHNWGARRLIVNEDHCACEDAEPAQAVIVDPGHSTTLTLQLDTHGTSGPLQHSWNYTTNDPDHPRFEVTVSATILSEQTVDTQSPNGAGV